MRSLLSVVLLMLCVGLNAQTFEIRTVNKGGGNIGVELRATSGTPPGPANYVTDLVFGIKWLASYNVNLGPVSTSYNIVKSDVRKTNGLYHFQAFSAANTPFAFPAQWTLNNWVEVLTVRNTMTGTGVGVFEIAEPGFDATTDPNLGIDLVDYTPTVAGMAINVPLPVRYVLFEAVPKYSVIVLNWSTETEENAKGFEIERSLNENTGFTRVGWVPVAGTDRGSYTWTDQDVVAQRKYYYRLKGVDADGKYKYSEVRMAQLDARARLALQLMPNPADKILTLVFEEDVTPGLVNIRVTDAKGAVVLTQTRVVNASRKADLDVSRLVQGQYFLYVENGKGVKLTGVFFKG